MSLPQVKNDPSKVQLTRLGHAYFEQRDLEQFAKFASDFGFVEAGRVDDTVYYRGYGRDPYVYVCTKVSSSNDKPICRGLAFVAASEEDFDKAAKIPGASPVKEIENAPGGGRMVTFARPNGTVMQVIYGQQEQNVDVDHFPSGTHDSQGPFNTPFNKPRKGQFQRYHDGPALVHKIGHAGYVVSSSDGSNFEKEFEFYTSNFNIVPSDVLWHPQFHEMDVMTFMHLDLGKEYSDHHVLFLQRGPPEVKQTYLHHSSFEVADFDTQLIGHQWLAKKQWKSVWGVGRHVLGSQIFDYWHDPSGFKIEHYADGDVVNVDNPTQRAMAGELSIWGPELPKDFGVDGTEISFG